MIRNIETFILFKAHIHMNNGGEIICCIPTPYTVSFPKDLMTTNKYV